MLFRSTKLGENTPQYPLQGSAPSGRFQFGDFSFDAACGSLTRKGLPVKLQAQPALALGLLLTNANRIVSREELRDVLWGTETFVDFDKGLNFCIAQIRQALQDEAARPVYLRTIPKQGYEFIAPVQRIPALELRHAPASEPPSPSRSWVIPCAAACTLLLFAAAVFLLHRKPTAPTIPTVAVVRFDGEPDTPSLQNLANSLTDNLIVQLASNSAGQYRVIGNAPLLQAPRDQRNLPRLASELHCSYAILGQVQSEGGQLVILAHLIRLSDLTHIWVVRLGPLPPSSPLRLPSQSAQRIAAEFAMKLAADPSHAASFGRGSH